MWFIWGWRESGYLNDEEVRVDDQEQRGEVDEHGVDQDVRATEPILGQVVGSASGHVAFRHIPEEKCIHVMVVMEVVVECSMLMVVLLKACFKPSQENNII